MIGLECDNDNDLLQCADNLALLHDADAFPASEEAVIEFQLCSGFQLGSSFKSDLGPFSFEEYFKILVDYSERRNFDTEESHVAFKTYWNLLANAPNNQSKNGLGSIRNKFLAAICGFKKLFPIDNCDHKTIFNEVKADRYFFHSLEEYQHLTALEKLSISKSGKRL